MSLKAARYSEAFTLRDGSLAVVRAIRPDDRERLRTAFSELDPESVYQRYFSYKRELSEADLDRLCNPDFHERVVLVVTQGVEADAVIVGSGGYVRHPTRDGSHAAECAFAVEEDVQGQGISSKLLAVLVALARADGLDRLDAEVLSRNAAMRQVFARGGLPIQVRSDDQGVVGVSLSLAPALSPAEPEDGQR